jgi:hypothetical protein
MKAAMLDARFKALPKRTREPGPQGVISRFKTPYNKTLGKMFMGRARVVGRFSACYTKNRTVFREFSRGSSNP